MGSIDRILRYLKLLVAFLLGFAIWGCSSTSYQMDYEVEEAAASSPRHRSTAESVGSVASTKSPRASSASRQRASAKSTGGLDSTESQGAYQEADRGERPEETTKEAVEGRGKLLIYEGRLVLAMYEVVASQERAIEIIEEMDGYVSRRTSESLILRVPAPSFRKALDELSQLGDLLDQRWTAQDVSDEVRDLDIRLQNARNLRDRLELLLDQAESVEDALKIEAELERITLEIERIRGQLLSFEDRIAYSTIEVLFQQLQITEVPDDRFLLPFRWLDQLGLESLFREPEVRR